MVEFSAGKSELVAAAEAVSRIGDYAAKDAKGAQLAVAAESVRDVLAIAAEQDRDLLTLAAEQDTPQLAAAAEAVGTVLEAAAERTRSGNMVTAAEAVSAVYCAARTNAKEPARTLASIIADDVADRVMARLTETVEKDPGCE